MDIEQMVTDKSTHQQAIDDQLRQVFARFPQITLAVLFGSVAAGRHRAGSDLDLAVSAHSPLSQDEKIALVSALAESTGRAIDLIDLNSVTEPLLGQIVQHGRKILGSDTLFGQLIYRHLIEQADFMPYRTRLLAERREAWIGK
ncbi:MAG: nucleotidyltransferase domain-containing protein [Burkholderiales bacterium]